MKIYMVSLFHRATIKQLETGIMINDTSQISLMQQCDLDVAGSLTITLLQIYCWGCIERQHRAKLWRKSWVLKGPVRRGTVLLKMKNSLEIWRMARINCCYRITLRLVGLLLKPWLRNRQISDWCNVNHLWLIRITIFLNKTEGPWNDGSASIGWMPLCAIAVGLKRIRGTVYVLQGIYIVVVIVKPMKTHLFARFCNRTYTRSLY